MYMSNHSDCRHTRHAGELESPSSLTQLGQRWVDPRPGTDSGAGGARCCDVNWPNGGGCTIGPKDKPGTPMPPDRWQGGGPKGPPTPGGGAPQPPLKGPAGCVPQGSNGVGGLSPGICGP